MWPLIASQTGGSDAVVLETMGPFDFEVPFIIA
jgi:hypothetical protein